MVALLIIILLHTALVIEAVLNYQSTASDEIAFLFNFAENYLFCCIFTDILCNTSLEIVKLSL